MSIQVVETPITPSFHEAFILSIVKVSKEHGIGIFEFIQFAISETNWKLSPGDINLSKYYPAYYVKTAPVIWYLTAIWDEILPRDMLMRSWTTAVHRARSQSWRSVAGPASAAWG